MGIYDDYMGSKEGEVWLDGKKLDVIWPRRHSSIEALAYKVTDHNPHKGMGSIPWLGTSCYVIPKGKKEWGRIFDGSSCDFKIGDHQVSAGDGLFHILYLLEGCKFKTEEEVRLEEEEMNKRALAAILKHAKTLNW